MPHITFATFSEKDLFHAFLLFVAFLAPSLFVCYALASQKGYNTVIAVIAGLVPGLNFYVMMYLIGAKDRHLDAKLDNILSGSKNHVPKD
jgi:hypothetical protein